MSLMSINRMEYKLDTVRRIRKDLIESNYPDKGQDISEKDLNAGIEMAIIKRLNGLVSELNNLKKLPYTKEEIVKQLRNDEKLKRMNIQSEKEIEEHFKDLFKEKINFIELKNEAYKNNESGSSITFSFTHDFFEIHEFRGRLTYSFDEVYASVRMMTGSPHGLVFIFASPIYVPKIRKVLRVFISDEFKFNKVTWSDQALRRIKDEYANEILSANANKVEGNIKVRATSQNLENKALFNELSNGEFTGITYNTKMYFPGNTVSINGNSGSVYSSLSDEDLITYVKDHLLKHANI